MNQNDTVMKNWTLLLATLILAISPAAFAQDEDDMYLVHKKEKATPRQHTVKIVYLDDDYGYDDDGDYYEEEPAQPITATRPLSDSRDVDEYNRRGHSSSIITSSDSVLVPAQVTSKDTRSSITYSLSEQNLYDLGYEEGYSQGFSDGEDLDYYYGLRLARFHGRHFYTPWYWSSVSYVYDPWYWDPWYYDPWYRPYYYGGWYSVGWGVGFWGTYWDPCWHGHYPYHPGHHPGHVAPPVIHQPRTTGIRNRTYARRSIVDRSSTVTSRNDYVARRTLSRNIGNTRYNTGANRNGDIQRVEYDSSTRRIVRSSTRTGGKSTTDRVVRRGSSSSSSSADRQSSGRRVVTGTLRSSDRSSTSGSSGRSTTRRSLTPSPRTTTSRPSVSSSSHSSSRGSSGTSRSGRR